MGGEGEKDPRPQDAVDPNILATEKEQYQARLKTNDIVKESSIIKPAQTAHPQDTGDDLFKESSIVAPVPSITSQQIEATPQKEQTAVEVQKMSDRLYEALTGMNRNMSQQTKNSTQSNQVMVSNNSTTTKNDIPEENQYVGFSMLNWMAP